MLALFVAEISNPCMNLKHILKLSGRRHTKIYEFAEVAFILFYIYGRMIAAIPIGYRNIMCEHNHLLFKVSQCGILGQSAWFVTTMV